MPGRVSAPSAPRLAMRQRIQTKKKTTDEHGRGQATGIRTTPNFKSSRPGPPPSIAMSIGSPDFSSLLFRGLAGIFPAHDALGVVLHVGVAEVLGGLRALGIGRAILVGAIRNDE